MNGILYFFISLIILLYISTYSIGCGYIFGSIKKRISLEKIKHNHKYLLFILIISWYLLWSFMFFGEHDPDTSTFDKIIIILFPISALGAIVYYIFFSPSLDIIEYFNKRFKGVCEICSEKSDNIDKGQFYYGNKTVEEKILEQTSLDKSLNQIPKKITTTYEIVGNRPLSFCKACAFTNYDKFLFLSPFLGLVGITLLILGIEGYLSVDESSALGFFIGIAGLYGLFGWLIAPFLFKGRLDYDKKASILLKDDYKSFNCILLPSEYDKIKNDSTKIINFKIQQTLESLKENNTKTETEIEETNNDKNMTNYCPFCQNYDENIGVCSEIHENVRSYPKKFINKCNGRFFIKI